MATTPTICAARGCDHPEHPGRACRAPHVVDEGEWCGCYGPCQPCAGSGVMHDLPGYERTCHTCQGTGSWPWPPDTPTDQRSTTVDHPLTTPDAQVGRHHPDTSYAAAAATLGRSGGNRHRLLWAIAEWPDFDEGLAQRCRLGMNTERPRRVELARMGYIEDSGKRATTEAGQKAIVWQATEAGRAALREAAA